VIEGRAEQTDPAQQACSGASLPRQIATAAGFDALPFRGVLVQTFVLMLYMKA
jgi:hypothetical protein